MNIVARPTLFADALVLATFGGAVLELVALLAVQLASRCNRHTILVAALAAQHVVFNMDLFAAFRFVLAVLLVATRAPFAVRGTTDRLAVHADETNVVFVMLLDALVAVLALVRIKHLAARFARSRRLFDDDLLFSMNLVAAAAPFTSRWSTNFIAVDANHAFVEIAMLLDALVAKLAGANIEVMAHLVCWRCAVFFEPLVAMGAPLTAWGRANIQTFDAHGA